MKIKFAIVTSFLLILFAVNISAQSYDNLWKQILETQKKELPKTVIGLCDKVIAKAKKENNHGQLLQAYFTRMVSKGSISNDSTYSQLKELEQWAATSNQPTERMLLHSILANFYAQYASNNRYEMPTNVTGIKPVEDIKEWTRIQFWDATIKHLNASLEDEKLLHSTNSEKYVPFAKQQWASIYYKHDLLHVLGYKAINSLETFRNVADKNQKVEVSQRIAQIYNDLITIYKQANEESAVILTTLDKLRFEYHLSGNKQKYLSGLEQLLSQTNPSNEVRAEILTAKALYYSQQKKQYLKKALSTYEEAITLYPKYARINVAKQEKAYITRPVVTLKNLANVVYPNSKIRILVNHRNADSFDVLYYRLPENLPAKDIKISNCKLESSQHFILKNSSDYQSKEDLFQINTPGFGTYAVIVKEGNDESYLKKAPERIIRTTKLKVLVMQTDKKKIDAVVVDANTGELVSGASVELANNNEKLIAKQTTDAQGRTTFITNGNNTKIRATKNDDKYMEYQFIYSWYQLYSSEKNTTSYARLITDRSIYRPGQTVYLKGIVYNQTGDSTKVCPTKTLHVLLRDANEQEIANKEVTTNEFGSFNLQFILPSTCLNGRFTIHTEMGQTSFNVEEYKRPTFEVTTDEIKSTYKLGDTIHVTGHAQSFSGIPITSCYAKYTVNRNKYMRWRTLGQQIIATDSVKINANGHFDLPVALTSESQNIDNDNEGEETQVIEAVEGDDDIQSDETTEEDEENGLTYYTFNVNIEVTNLAGETQNGNVALAVGSQSLILNRASEENICKDKAIKVRLEATNLLQKPVDTTINYALYSVKKGEQNNLVDKGSITANNSFDKEEWRKLPSGKYELRMTATDSQGREVKRTESLVLFSATDKQPADESNIWLYIPNKEKNGKCYTDLKHPAQFYFGTAQKDATILMDVFADGKRIESKVLKLSNEIKSFEYPYNPSYKDGISFNFCFVKDNLLFQEEVTFARSLPVQQLRLKWSVFRDKIHPGQKEEWKLNIQTPQGKPANAEMLAFMYDASLDKLTSHNIYGEVFYPRDIQNQNWRTSYQSRYDETYFGIINSYNIKQLEFDHLWDVNEWINMANEWKRNRNLRIGGRGLMLAKSSSPLMESTVIKTAEVKGNDEKNSKEIVELNEVMAMGIDSRKKDEATSGQQPIRSNFAETAFFYPSLRTDSKGDVSIVFTLPESLTRWKFMGYAHTKEMLNGMLGGETVASKELMLTPNMPRFVRTGDHAVIAATVSNMTDKAIKANVKFELFDPQTEQIILSQSKPLSLGAQKSEGTSFDFTVSERYDILGVRIVADGGTFSDGEQHLLPVLSNKIMLTESIPLPIRGNQSREFSLDKLFNNHSKTATKRSLTIEYTGNPSWYAIQALPSLALPQSDNAICWAIALYANSLASHIANSTPRIKNIFDSWKATGQSKESLLSNLQKNQELKNILLNESPWVLEAKSEQEQKERLSTLFDLNNIQNNNLTTVNKLQQLQNEDGSWSWFKGMKGSEYITEYVVRLIARIHLLTGQPLSEEVKAMQQKGIGFLHGESQRQYEWIKKAEKEGQKIKGISYSTLRYLYLLSITDSQIPNQYKTQYNYFLNKIDEVPSSLDMQEKALAAVILKQADKTKAANEYMASIKEHLTKSDELGEYFDFNDDPFSWGCMHLNAHTAAIEAFENVSNDYETAQEMKLWLLKQKQTQLWDTPVSTADAICALVGKSTDILSNKGTVDISIASRKLSTDDSNTTTGLSYLKDSFTDQPTINARSIKVEKKDADIAWGAVYAQFTEEISNVKQQGSEAFSVKKALFVKRIVNNVEELQPITDQNELKIGDIVTARLVIKLNRKMDFVQLKEQRGACFEPMTQLSGYHYEAGTGYYEEIKDASTNFFFDSLQKGTYVLEINYRVSRAGSYEAGLSTLQCAYAPEFATHSESMRITINK
ncbi:MAG: alpha-2-macroglobulin [Bacteroidales bacterium]|nr:alpha-2-macroglobulin [Bacteroidales bacterium]